MSAPRKYFPGAHVSGATIVAVEGGRFFYRCDRCAMLNECGRAAIYARAKLALTHCLYCRPRPVVDAECADCGRALKRRLGRGPYRCRRCKRKHKRAYRRDRTAATLGRTCIGCCKSDANARWSKRRGLCCACARAGARNGWCECGSPLWKGTWTGELRCRAGCK